MKRIVLIICAALSCSAALAKKAAAPVTVPASDSRITVIGRSATAEDGSVAFNWSGTTFAVSFTGQSLSLRASDSVRSMFNVWIDREPAADPDFIITVADRDSCFVLAEKLAKGEHFAYVQRRTEGRYGTTVFHSFTAEGFIQARPLKSRLIEFIGDSLTAGYGNESEEISERYRLETQNASKSWSFILGRFFDADVLNLAHSGMGVARNNGDKMPHVYMDSLYPLVIDAKEKPAFNGPFEGLEWKAAKDGVKPSVTVIYLGANDFSGGRQPVIKAFCTHYRKLIEEVRTNWGEDHPVICVAYERHPMIYDYIIEATRDLENVHCVAMGDMIMNYDNRDCGASHHPKYSGQIKYAYALIPYIATVTGWPLDGKVQ